MLRPQDEVFIFSPVSTSLYPSPSISLLFPFDLSFACPLSTLGRLSLTLLFASFILPPSISLGEQIKDQYRPEGIKSILF